MMGARGRETTHKSTHVFPFSICKWQFHLLMFKNLSKLIVTTGIHPLSSPISPMLNVGLYLSPQNQCINLIFIFPKGLLGCWHPGQKCLLLRTAADGSSRLFSFSLPLYRALLSTLPCSSSSSSIRLSLASIILVKLLLYLWSFYTLLILLLMTMPSFIKIYKPSENI